MEYLEPEVPDVTEFENRDRSGLKAILCIFRNSGF